MALEVASEQALEDLASMMRLFGDKTRLHILMLLAECDRNVIGLSEILGQPQSTISHHVGLLRLHNLIEVRRHGRQLFYTLSNSIDLKIRQKMLVDAGMWQISIGANESSHHHRHSEHPRSTSGRA